MWSLLEPLTVRAFDYLMPSLFQGLLEMIVHVIFFYHALTLTECADVLLLTHLLEVLPLAIC